MSHHFCTIISWSAALFFKNHEIPLFFVSNFFSKKSKKKLQKYLFIFFCRFQHESSIKIFKISRTWSPEKIIFQNVLSSLAHARLSGNSWMNFLIFIPQCTFCESVSKDIFSTVACWQQRSGKGARHRFEKRCSVFVWNYCRKHRARRAQSSSYSRLSFYTGKTFKSLNEIALNSIGLFLNASVFFHDVMFINVNRLKLL